MNFKIMEEKQLYKEKIEILLRDIQDRLDLKNSGMQDDEDESIGLNYSQERNLMEDEQEEVSSLLENIIKSQDNAWQNIKVETLALLERFKTKYDFA